MNTYYVNFGLSQKGDNLSWVVNQLEAGLNKNEVIFDLVIKNELKHIEDINLLKKVADVFSEFLSVFKYYNPDLKEADLATYLQFLRYIDRQSGILTGDKGI